MWLQSCTEASSRYKLLRMFYRSVKRELCSLDSRLVKLETEADQEKHSLLLDWSWTVQSCVSQTLSNGTHISEG